MVVARCTASPTLLLVIFHPNNILQIALSLFVYHFLFKGAMPASTVKVVLLGNSGVGKTCLRSQFVHHIFTNGYKATIGGDYLTAQVSVNSRPMKTPDATGSLEESDIANYTTQKSVSGPQTRNNALDQPFDRDVGSVYDTLAKSVLMGQKVVQNLQNTRQDQTERKEGENLTAGSPYGASRVESASENTPSSTPLNLQIWDTAGQERFNSISQAFYRGTDVCVLVYDTTNYELVLSLRDWFSRFMEHSHVERPGVLIVGNKIDRASERVVDIEEVREIILSNTTISVENYVLDWETDLLEITCKKRDLAERVFLRVGELALARINGESAPNRILGFDTIDLEGSKKAHSSGCAC